MSYLISINKIKCVYGCTANTPPIITILILINKKIEVLNEFFTKFQGKKARINRLGRFFS